MRDQKIKKQDQAANQDDELLNEIFDGEIDGFDGFDNLEDIEIPPYSRRHKIRMNRLFRERVGGTFIPYPDVDNFYEKARSKIVVILKINEFLDRCKKRRRNR